MIGAAPAKGSLKIDDKASPQKLRIELPVMVQDGPEKYRIELREAFVDMSVAPIKIAEKGVGLAVGRSAWDRLANKSMESLRKWFWK